MNSRKTLLKYKPNCPVVADDISNHLNYKYGAMSERLFVILNGKIVYLGGKGPVGYHVGEVEDWLTKYTS